MAVPEPLSGVVVLVVDDDNGVLGTLACMLKAAGCKPLLASEADTALRVLTTTTVIHLALIDVGLPGVSGPQLARRMLECRPDLPILFMSGHAPERVEALTEGLPFKAIQKPFKIQGLVGDICGALRPASAGPALHNS